MDLNNINNKEELDAAIAFLKDKQKTQKQLLVAQIDTTVDSLKPINLLKSTLQKVSQSPELKDEMVNMAAGVGAGLITKKIIGSHTSSVIRNVVATLVELGVIGVVAKKADTIKSLGNFVLSKIMTFIASKKEQKEKAEELEEQEEENEKND